MDPNENYNIIKETDIKQIIINNGEKCYKEKYVMLKAYKGAMTLVT